MEIITKFALETEPTFNSVSVLKLSITEFNGEEVEVGRERRAFTPTQINELKEYAPALEDVCRALWTEEVITDYKEKVERNK